MQILATPLGLGVTIIIIIVVASYIYVNRKSLYKWLKKTRISKLSIGPVEIEINKVHGKDSENKDVESKVDFGKGNVYSGTRITKVAGRDIIQAKEAKNKKKDKSDSSVDFGDSSDFTDARIDSVAGRDIDTDLEA